MRKIAAFGFIEAVHQTAAFGVIKAVYQW